QTNTADSATTLFQGGQSATLQEPGTAFWAFGNTVGVLGQAGQDGTVPANQTTGTLKFNAAGTATVPAGSQSVTITPHVDLTVGHPKVFVTVQSAGGTFKRVGISGTQLTLFLTSAAQGNVKLAYFI